MIAIYKGISFISRMIRVMNWSEFSHAAWIDNDGAVIQAWKQGVTRTPDISTGHKPGTHVMLYVVADETPAIQASVKQFMHAQIGRKYDTLGILGFVLRSRNLQRQNKWFCSELVAEAYRQAGLPLINMDSCKVYPGMLAASTHLRYIRTEVTR